MWASLSLSLSLFRVATIAHHQYNTNPLKPLLFVRRRPLSCYFLRKHDFSLLDSSVLFSVNLMAVIEIATTLSLTHTHPYTSPVRRIISSGFRVASLAIQNDKRMSLGIFSTFQSGSSWFRIDKANLLKTTRN